MKKNLLICLFAAATLTACSTATPPAQSFGPQQSGFRDFGKPLGNHFLTWPERQTQLTSLQSWHTQGSIAIHSVNKGWNASFNWQQQDAQNYNLALFGPLGINRTVLSGSPQGVVLQTAKGAVSANSAETLLQQQIGWYLPVSNLYYWIRGLPSPHAKTQHYSYDMNRHLAQLTQDGWHIIYLRYLSIDGIDLPDRMLISNPSMQVRIVISRWEINT